MPTPSGIIFSYLKDTVDDNVIVAYKMITFDNGRFTDVAKIFICTQSSGTIISRFQCCATIIYSG